MGAEVPGLDYGVQEGGDGESGGEVELAIEGGHPATRHQPPVRILHQQENPSQYLL